MKLEDIELGKLNDAPYNPRIKLEPGMEEYEKLKASIEKFGDVEPIVWNKRTGNVIGGHQRLHVLRDLGRKTAKVSVVELDEQQEKMLNLALNKARGDWDTKKLEDLLRGMELDDLEFSGFGADEVAILLESNDGIDDDWQAGEADDDWTDDIGIYGASYLVTIRTQDAQAARDWLAKEGIEHSVSDSSHTTVVRFGEGEEA